MQNPIRYKKQPYPISEGLLAYLKKYSRNVKLPVTYDDFMRFNDGLPIYDEKGGNTLWLSAFYGETERKELDDAVKRIYSILHVDGSSEMIPYLNVDAIDFCTFGNTKPFRVKVRNILNDNYVFFYIKKADASRVYGLELEHLLSPNQINFLVQDDTLIEEHISGIPGDYFIDHYLFKCTPSEKSAIAKEFVKFNERCFVRLLGDMRAYNYVVVLTHDFDRIQYRFRAIDFDQQSYEGDKDIYAPKSFKENKPLLDLVNEVLSNGSVEQYKREERGLIAKRASSEEYRLRTLIECMCQDILAPIEHVDELRAYLYGLTRDVNFKRSKNMGDLLASAIDFVLRNYQNINPYIIH